MTRYLAGRVVAGIVTLAVFVTLLFFVMNLAVPGDWTSQFLLTADQRAALSEQVGTDRPLWEQYWSWLSATARFDLGTSFSGDRVWDIIRDAMASTLLVLAVGIGIAFWLGGTIGRSITWSGRRLLGAGVVFLSVLLLTVFPPALAFTLERGALNALGSGRLARIMELDPERWSAVSTTPGEVLWRMVLVLAVALALVATFAWAFRKARGKAPPPLLTMLLVVCTPLILGWLFGWAGLAFDLSARLAFITLAVVVLTFGEVVLITRATMEDTMNEGFVAAARAKGLPDRYVRDHHAARAALLPTLSRLVVAIPYFLTGLVILEGVFDVSGLGSVIFEALRVQDTPVVAGAMLVVGAITVALRIGLDLAHSVLDPRIRFATEPGRGR